MPSFLLPRIGLTALIATSVAATHLMAQELPVVPGIALLHASNPEACLASGLDTTLSRIARDERELRAVAFSWSDLTAIADAQAGGTFPPSEAPIDARARDQESQAPTVLLFPDGQIHAQSAACDDPGLSAPASGRIWALELGGRVSDPTLALPPAWDRYAAAQEGPVASCLLMGGAFTRQPALAAALSAEVAADIAEHLPDGAHIHESRLAAGLLNPGAARLLGREAVLLTADRPEDLFGATPCEFLTEALLDSDAAAPTLGPDPTALRRTCPASGLATGETFRASILFDDVASDVTEDAAEILGTVAACAAASRDAADGLSLTIEAYGSTSGSSRDNWEISAVRANATRDAAMDAFREAGVREIDVVIGGFGRSAAFADDQDGNRTAILSLTAAPLPRPGTGAADSALLRRHLGASGTCNAEPLEASRTADFIPFLASDFGTELRQAIQAPDFVMIFHNAPDTTAFARRLQSEVRGTCAGTQRPTHVGFLYKRTGPPFWQDPDRDAAAEPPASVTDYFVLPPKITWIYDDTTSSDYAALARAAVEFGLDSQNISDLGAVAALQPSERRRQLGQLDVLTIGTATPISRVLGALAAANVGTGWVFLTGGWD